MLLTLTIGNHYIGSYFYAIQDYILIILVYYYITYSILFLRDKLATNKPSSYCSISNEKSLLPWARIKIR